MKLTSGQLKALEAINRWNTPGRVYNKSAAAGTAFATREPQLYRLERLGLIHSARPFSGSYHTVTLTEAGCAALKEKEE